MKFGTHIVKLSKQFFYQNLIRNPSLYLNHYPFTSYSIPIHHLLPRNATSISRHLSTSTTNPPLPLNPAPTLPPFCPGCGAPSQSDSPHAAGYYSLTRPAVSAFLCQMLNPDGLVTPPESDQCFMRQPNSCPDKTFSPHHLQIPSSITSEHPPVCNRCHDLIHHSRGIKIVYPSLSNIANILQKSPHKRNQVYHVIDAADFPLSMVSGFHNYPGLPQARPRNRRNRNFIWRKGGIMESSFIITRCDLLTPNQDHLDKLKPKLIEVLRDHMGESSSRIRLGNVHCVSSHRGWRTRYLKETILKRRETVWMVGRVNVGKSSLVRSILPRGGGLFSDVENSGILRRENKSSSLPELPSSQPFVPYPVLPTVSTVAGTTAMPIRLPYGVGGFKKPVGEIIDLPGLKRPSITDHINSDYRSSHSSTAFIMQRRISPSPSHLNMSVKPGQSLLLGGGLVRFTPIYPNSTVFLFTPFVPHAILPHVTSTAKAIALSTADTLAHEAAPACSNICSDDARNNIQSAGQFALKWDVTRTFTGPLTRKDAARVPVTALPFEIFATDILLEGLGWVEVHAQLRKKCPPESESICSMSQTVTGEERNNNANQFLGKYPIIEVFSPYGKHIAIRRPLCISAFKRPAKVSVRNSVPSLTDET